MINCKNVVRLKMPYPNINSGLAMSAHMYLCKTPGPNKELLKIQTIKNKHIIDGFPIHNYYTLDEIDQSNPCNRDSFVDLEKVFNLDFVKIPITLTTVPGLNDFHFNRIREQMGRFQNIRIDTTSFLSTNSRCTLETDNDK